jgi:sec-independent protein translocase protein TatA
MFSIAAVGHVYEANILGPMEIGLLCLVVLLLFGAKRIPEIAGSFGKGIREFKKSMSDVQREIEEPSKTDALPPASTPVRNENVEAREPKRLM